MSSNRRAVAAGAALTTLSTVAVFVLPALIPLQELKLFLLETTGSFPTGNPFTQLRFLGGIPGALLAGYFSRADDAGLQSSVSMKAGTYASLLGLAGIYGLLVVGNVARAVATGETPAMFTIMLISLVLLFPLVPIYLIEGVAFGAAGNWLHSR